MNDTKEIASNFIYNLVAEDLKTGKHNTIITRFPPEPNGYLHIGHAKSICLNFGLSNDFNGKCNLRFDDTNPEKESIEYVNSIANDIKWLGFDWDGDIKYASDYFDKLYEFAVFFINQGLAYVCDLNPEEIRINRGNLTQAGKNSPYRNRSIEENLDLFTRMKSGEFADGSKTLRLKIDMTSPNINLRDPVIYRIKRAHHIRTQNKWCIYPMYDYTHCVSDTLEQITHSCCTLEFEDHRPLYDFVVEHLHKAGLVNCHPHQIEFSRLQLQYTVTSKRKLNQLIQNNIVTGWDDPRMPTISGMRTLGYPASAIRLFAKRAGVSKSPNIVDIESLEAAVRDELEANTPRIMAVLDPIKIVLTNFDVNDTSSRSAAFHPQKPELGERVVELTPTIFIERSDFMEIAESGFQRLSLNGEVRLRHSYVIKCENVIKDPTGNITELHCSIDKNTLGKNPEGRKVKGVIHWVSATNNICAQVNLYERLFMVETPDEGGDYIKYINPNSLKVVNGYIEPIIANSNVNDRFQFERLGYFIINKISDSKQLIINRTVNLKDSWRKHVPTI